MEDNNKQIHQEVVFFSQQLAKKRKKINRLLDKAKAGDRDALQYLHTEFRLKQYTQKEIDNYKL